MSSHQPTRVAILARAVYPLHGYGGLERHVYDLARHLADRDVGVTLVTRRPLSRPGVSTPRHDPPAGLGHENIRVIYVPYWTFPFAGRRGTTVLDRSTAYPLFGERVGRVAVELARAGAIDLVHGLGASALGYARHRHRLGTANLPFVFNPQGLEEFGATDPKRARLKQIGYWPLQVAVRACARVADRVIATDVATEPVVRHHLNIPAARVRVVPNAVDLGRCAQLAGPAEGAGVRPTLGLDPDTTVLLSVGRLEESKGFHVMAASLAAISARAVDAGSSSDWHWVLIGDGPYGSTLRRTVSRAGLDSRVHFLGRLKDAALHAWYEAATLFVHPTLYEGSSLVTLEAMAHRLAVVASAAGGLPDKVLPGVNGWLVPPGEPTALAHALVEARSDPARLRAMGEESRHIVERDFSWPAVTGTLLRVYDELLAG